MYSNCRGAQENYYRQFRLFRESLPKTLGSKGKILHR